MTSTITSRRPPPAFTPSQHPDEGYLNRSLLDNIDAQGDAEPMSSSDSEATGASVTPFSSLSTASSLGSPSIPYQHQLSMQSPLAPPRADSPNHHALPAHLKSPQHSDIFSQGPQNNTSHSMYNSLNSIGLSPSEFSLSSTEPDALNFHSKVNGSFASAPFRTSTSFASFPNRTRHPQATFRDTSSAFPPSAYPTSNDVFGAPHTPVSHMPPSQVTVPHSLESLQSSGRPFDYAPGVSQVNGGASTNGVSQTQQLFGGVDTFRQGPDSTPTLAQKHQGGVSGSQSLLQNGQHSHQSAFQTPFVNGLGGHSLGHGLHTQPQYGAPLPVNGSGPPQGGPQPTGVPCAPGMNHTNGPAPASQAQEEISTIFVVGFPDDMSEREFQNMFTFSAGFEAATLKIPNKESTSYGNPSAQGGRPQGLPMPFGSSNDPYNLVTMNQGGVLIDSGRDGSMASWPTSVPNDDGHFMQNNMPMQPPRKQIIGFAKFRSRNEALEARDVLQGRRVDVEKGAVLKAEMAKKNLHTKRGPGVGPLGLPSFPSGVPAAAPDNLTGLPSLPAAGEALAQRDKQLGALGAMGIDLSGYPQRRDRLFDGRDDEDRDRRRGEFSAALGPFGTRGPRERAEEDERERERKRREKERETVRLRQNTAFEAFHSVPQQMVRQGANSLLSAENGLGPNGFSFPSPPSIQSMPSQAESMTGPWGNLRDVSASAALRKMGVPQHHFPALPARPSSPSTTSPSRLEAIVNLSAQASVFQTAGFGTYNPQSSPESLSSSLPSHPSLPSRPHPQSPSSEPQLQSNHGQVGHSSSLPNSKASSVNGSQSGHEEELVRSVGALALSTDSGSTSPQLPSPASGTSSGRNGSDQNPPINTLYVGNLPTSTPPGGHTLSYLEDRLKELFSNQLGYRKLCFRQKSNGPMCFVEFETVEYATKALNELYGDTLNGLVRNGGIRLSYSKNPLGVRTPNSGGNGPSLLQQQQQPIRELQDGIRDAFPSDTFPHSLDTIRAIRRDTSGMTSPTSSSSYHYTASPPPRFFSPPPPSGIFGSLASSTSFPRVNPQGFGFASGSTTFSPFSIPHTSIPDQPVADSSNDHLAHPLTPVATNIEASRAG